jgi:NodT family efflux transporter outer membrane factor (OMF) lipoprotein
MTTLPRVRPAHALAPLFASALALSACANAPDLGAPLPSGSKALATPLASIQASAANPSPWPADAWWRTYRDPQLDALVDEALTGAPDIASAAARVRAADAAAEQAGAARRPALSADARPAEVKQSRNNGGPAALMPHGWNDTGQVSLDLAWDLDFWGRNRKALEAALSSAGAARADAAAARLALAAAVAGAYGDFAQLYADRDAAADALATRDATLRLVAERAQQGLETRSALKRAEAGRAAAAADLAAVDEQLALARDRIAVLVGQGPDRGRALRRPVPPALKAFGLPGDLQADFLGRRPDLAAARLRAQAAARRVGMARADFYPNVRLSALVGLQSLGLDTLTRAGSAYGSVGPAFSLPIFSAGRLEGAYRGARAEYDLAVAAYDSVLVHALGEVADVAASEAALGPRLSRSREALDASQAAYRLAVDRYRSGLSGYLDVLAAEDAQIAARRAVADLETRAFILDVALAKALGGGFRQSPAAAD